MFACTCITNELSLASRAYGSFYTQNKQATRKEVRFVKNPTSGRRFLEKPASQKKASLRQAVANIHSRLRRSQERIKAVEAKEEEGKKQACIRGRRLHLCLTSS